MKRSRGRLLPILLALVVLCGVGLAAWYLVPRIGVSSAADIKAECGKKAAMEVTVRGRVDSATNIPLSDWSAFKVLDDSGTMWVFAPHDAPREGEVARVTGKTFSAADIAKSCGEGGLGEDVCKVLASGIRFVSESCVLVANEKR